MEVGGWRYTGGRKNNFLSIYFAFPHPVNISSMFDLEKAEIISQFLKKTFDSSNNFLTNYLENIGIIFSHLKNHLGIELLQNVGFQKGLI